jgi:hypothetical protein
VIPLLGCASGEPAATGDRAPAGGELEMEAPVGGVAEVPSAEPELTIESPLAPVATSVPVTQPVPTKAPSELAFVPGAPEVPGAAPEPAKPNPSNQAIPKPSTSVELQSSPSRNLVLGGDFEKNYGSWKMMNAAVVGSGSSAKVKLEPRGFVQVNIDLGPNEKRGRFVFGAFVSNDVSGSVSFTDSAGNELDRFLLPRVRQAKATSTSDLLPKEATRAVITFTYQPGNKKSGSGVVDNVVLYTRPGP